MEKRLIGRSALINVAINNTSGKYTLANKNGDVEGKKIIGLSIVNGTNVVKAKTGESYETLANTKTCFITLKDKSGKSVVDEMPLDSLLTHQSNSTQLFTPIEPVVLDLTKCIIETADASGFSTGRVIGVQLFYED